MFNRFKIFIFLLVAGFLFLTTAGPILAAQDPAKDPLCWQEKVCYAALTEMKKTPTPDSWQSPGPNNRCGSDLGVCLPAGTTQLEIKIGQTTEAKDLGDYIKTIYVYLLGIGGIVAAVLLIKGGFEWMTLGGGESKKNAQATIAGALTGLLLLLGSYVLLYTINPDLVNLKLPQVYMVRPAELIDMAEGSLCRDQGPLNAACVGLGQPGEYACRQFHVEGSGPFTQLFKDEPVEMMLLMTSLVPGGGVAGLAFKSLEKVAGLAVKPLGKVLLNAFGTPAQKIMQSWASLGAKKIALESGYGGALWEKALNGDMVLAKQIVAKDVSGIQRKLFGQAIVTTFRESWVLSKNTAKVGGIIIGGGATYVISGKVYDILKGNNEPGEPGICDKTLKLPEASLCNAKMKPSDCASGSCVAVVDMYGWSTNLIIGVCSPGGAGNPCNEESKDTDCGDKDGPFQCIENECSNGSINTTCKEDKDCKSNMKCLAAIGKMRCTNEGAVGEGVQCQKVTKTANDAGDCQKGLTCLAPPKEKSGPIGICTAGQIESPCYQNADCQVKNNPIQAVVKCLGSQTVDKPYKTGKCLFLYYNSKPSEPGFANQPVLENEIYTSQDVGCSSPNDCENTNCIIGGLGGESNSCGKAFLP